MTEEEKSNKTGESAFSDMLSFYDNWVKTWSKAMSEVTTSEKFAETTGQQMETNLDMVGLMRKQVAELMEQYLKGMNLATHSEVVNLAERLIRVEMTLDDIDAKLDEILTQLEKK